MPNITTAHRAELNAAAKMRAMGYVDAASTTGGSDGGIDVRSRRGLARVKWRGGVAGRPDLQRLYGAGDWHQQGAAVLLGKWYSRQAVDYAKTVGTALYEYDPTGEIEKVSGAGTLKVDRRRWHASSERQVIGLLILAGMAGACSLTSLARATAGR